MKPKDLENKFMAWEPQVKISQLNDDELSKWSARASVLTTENLLLPTVWNIEKIIGLEADEFEHRMNDFVIGKLLHTTDDELLQLANGAKNLMATTRILLESINQMVGDRIAATLIIDQLEA